MLEEKRVKFCENELSLKIFENFFGLLNILALKAHDFWGQKSILKMQKT